MLDESRPRAVKKEVDEKEMSEARSQGLDLGHQGQIQGQNENQNEDQAQNQGLAAQLAFLSIPSTPSITIPNPPLSALEKPTKKRKNFI